MTFTAHINVMPLKELLDPQGKAVMSGLKNLGITQINDVRIGKHIILHIEAATKEEAQTLAENACQKLLANQVMESFEVTIQ
ncbi:phosphoribosylformylglycinamidine synthase subunit PurS [Chitinophaga sancti]|uniref:phosphoribosylformylglycinamidine synthase subunit PurS n=1 Tax=Chitinophaga sancti TaxID=1004 RepID=UPI002A762216|nr:phosphoribosylformylglycinamidine synthase subunit PurS [Chitinophaga sancti]WPQ62888.1 phosphoribosylformylglycinamidine synthase subunit PurS [Chitinophaga sancti]